MGQSHGKDERYIELDEVEEKRRPIVQVEDIEAAPYDVLRRLNVIRPRGRLKGDLLEYDRERWVHAKSRKEFREEVPHVLPMACRLCDRHDIQPIAVIRVVGHVDFETFVTSVELKRQTEKQRIFEELKTVPGIIDKLTATLYGMNDATEGIPEMLRSNTHYLKAASHGYEALLDGSDDEAVAADEEPPPVKDVKEYKEWRDGLQKHQIGRFIKQYLQRAIPGAAKSLGGIVFVTDDVVNGSTSVTLSDISKSLNKGMFAKKKAGTEDECLQSGATRSDYYSSEPMLVGVHTWLTEKPKDESLLPQEVEVGVQQVADRLAEFSGHLFLTEQEISVMPARKSKVLDYASAMIKVLQDGNDPEPGKDQMPFRLKCTGSCIVLVGGDLTSSVLELQHASAQNIPVLVIEGSGGYADVLCNTIRRVEEVVGSPSLDDYRNCLGTISPRTSSIISSGCIKVVSKGTSTEQFQKMLEKAVTHDETLHTAWIKYATWDYNSQYCRKLFINLQVLILFLGILATTLSIFQTFLQLQYPNDTGSTTTTPTSTVGHVYTWVGLVVVVLPVGLSLVEAIENKLNAGGRWVALRSASETLLREIYMYRTQVRAYSHQAIKKSIERGEEQLEPADPKATEAKNEEDEEEGDEGPDASVDKKVEENLSRTDYRVYKTRQEKLSHWMEHLIAELKESECANNSLQEYNGPLPPWHIQDTEDDGWSDLTPDEYVAYRLTPLIARYERAAKYYEAQLSLFTISNYVLGAIGTLLAALSSVPPLQNYNLQAWVALTTGISSAATRYMDYARMDFLQKKSNKIRMELADVRSWWDSRGTEAGTQHVRNSLVTQVEALVTGEFVEWGGQMKKAMSKSKKERKESKETSELIKQVKATADLEAATQLKELGLADITADTLQAALENPTGPEGVKIFDSMTRLTAHIEKTTGIDATEVLNNKLKKEAERKIAALQSVSDQFLDDNGHLLDINLGGMALGDFVPAEIETFIKQPKERRKMFREIENINPALLSRTDCLNILSKGGAELKKKVLELPHRQMLETIKTSIVDQLHEELINGLKNFNICIYDLIPRDEMVTELLLELRDIGKVDWRERASSDILSMVKNEEIKNRMKDLNEVALRGLLKRADKLFKSKTAQVFHAVVEKIARLDVEELFDTTERKAEVFDTLEGLQNNDRDMCFLTKDELLAKLPKRIASLPHIKDKPQAQIVEYINTVKCGFSASRIFQAFKTDFKSGASESVLNSILKNKRLCDRFVFAVKSIGQLEINRCDKKMLMRKLAMSPAFSQDMVDELKYLGEPILKRLMSGLKSFISNSYQGRVFDILCDEVTTFDLRNLLPDAEDRERFVNQVREFKGVRIVEAVKSELITTMAYQALIVKFLKLSVEQMRELVERALVLMGNSFHNGIFTTSVVAHFAEEVVMDELEKWDEESTDRLCVCLLKLQDNIMNLMPPSVKDFLEHGTGDPTVYSNKMFSLLPDQSLHTMLSSWDVDVQLRVLVKMQELLGERVLANVFETSSRELPPPLASKFQLVFTDPAKREYMLECLTCLTQRDFEELSEMDADTLIDTMENRDPQKREFLTILCKILDSANNNGGTPFDGFKMLVLHLLNEILITVPYRLFLKLCLQITSFDLREILDDPQSRRLVAVVFLKCAQEGNSNLRNTEAMKGRDILDACDMLLEYEMVVNDLRMLTEDQLKLLVEEMLNFFETKPIGMLFARFLAGQSSGANKVEYGTLIEAVVSIKGHLQIAPVKVRTDFRFFDAEQFFSVLTEEEKIVILQKYIPDDSCVRKIAQFSQLQFRRLFAHICAIPSSQAEESQSCSHRSPVDMKQHHLQSLCGKGIVTMMDRLTELATAAPVVYNTGFAEFDDY